MARRPSTNPAGNPATLKPGNKQGKASLTDRLRSIAEASLGELDKRHRPLYKLLADAFEANPAATLNAVVKLLPVEAKVEHSVSTTELHLQALREITRRQIPSPVEPMPVVIDVQAVTVDPTKPSE